jgi:hypothetical protein
MGRRKGSRDEPDPNTIAFKAAWQALSRHPMFAPMTADAWPRPSAGAALVEDSALGYASVCADGRIRANKGRRLDEDQWTWVLAHCLLHLGFGHLEPAAGRDQPYLDVACLVVTRFQRAVKLGREPALFPTELPSSDEHILLREWRHAGIRGPPGPASTSSCAGWLLDGYGYLPTRSWPHSSLPELIGRYAGWIPAVCPGRIRRRARVS